LGGPSYLARVLLYLARGRSRGASDEHLDFDAAELPPSPRPMLVPRRDTPLSAAWIEQLTSTQTRAFRVYRDSAMTSWDAPGDRPERPGRLYSITKSVLSLAWGAADAEGLVPKLDEPVYRGLTVRNLLRMDSGLAFDEGFHRLNRQVLTYLHPNARSTAYRARLTESIGKDFHYNDFHSLLLGVLLEKGLVQSGWTPSGSVTEPVAAWVWERILEPVGMAHPGRFVVDSHRRRFPKTESGLCLAADDVVRLGLLVLNEGRINGKTIVPPSWIAESTTPEHGWSGAASFARYRGMAWGPWLSTGRGFYGWHWWGRHETGAPPTVFAMGVHGQLLIISPRHRAVVVRLADRWALKAWWPDVILDALDACEL
jgi:CubicO group peptidase (beta-lactamase class C family)